MSQPNLDPTTPQADAAGLALPRRKLLRGAMAVPAVLTVCSGSALATSSFKRCLRNANEHPVTGSITPMANTDNLVRVALWERPKSGGGKTYYVRGSSFPHDTAVGSAVPGQGQWQQFNVGTNELVANTRTSQQPSNVTQSTDKWVAVRYDVDGTIVGVGKSGSGTAIGTSCWTSFAILKSGL